MSQIRDKYKGEFRNLVMANKKFKELFKEGWEYAGDRPTDFDRDYGDCDYEYIFINRRIFCEECGIYCSENCYKLYKNYKHDWADFFIIQPHPNDVDQMVLHFFERGLIPRTFITKQFESSYLTLIEYYQNKSWNYPFLHTFIPRDIYYNGKLLDIANHIKNVESKTIKIQRWWRKNHIRM